jgi:hypothetical protein
MKLIAQGRLRTENTSQSSDMPNSTINPGGVVCQVRRSIRRIEGQSSCLTKDCSKYIYATKQREYLLSSIPYHRNTIQHQTTVTVYDDIIMATSVANVAAPEDLSFTKTTQVEGYRPVQADDSAARRVKDNEHAELKIAEETGAPDVYVDSEKDTLWYLWTGSIYCKVSGLRTERVCT